MEGHSIRQHHHPEQGLHHHQHVVAVGHGGDIYLAPAALPPDLLGHHHEDEEAPPAAVPKESSLLLDEDSEDNKDDKGKHRSWEDNFAALVVYKENFGDCFVPVGYPPDPTLGRWCAKLRKLKSTLKPERRARLEYLGFSFTNPKQAVEDKNWNDNFDRLKAHYMVAGNNNNSSNNNNNSHLHPQILLNPDIHTISGKAKLDPALNRWVSRQRRNKKDGILTEERIQKLESIGFRWVLVEQKRKDYSKKDLHWIQQYNSLASFQKQYGHTNPPHGKQSPYWQLAKWVARQRELYGQKRLLDDRKELLDALGFCWSMDDKAWQENFCRLVSHVQAYQHLDFQNDSSLGRWFYSQKVRYANGQMTRDRSRLLQSLGIEFEGSKAFLKTGNEPDREDESDDAHHGDKKKSAKRKADGSTNTNPQQLLFTVDFPMQPPKGTKVRKKRFMDGWCTGEVMEVDQRDVEDNRIKARVRYEDGMEEYMSEEECRISAIAYELHTTTPKLKLSLPAARPQPPSKRKRGRPPKSAVGRNTSISFQKKGSATKTQAGTGSSKKKLKTVGTFSVATGTAAAPNNSTGDNTEFSG